MGAKGIIWFGGVSATARTKAFALVSAIDFIDYTIALSVSSLRNCNAGFLLVLSMERLSAFDNSHNVSHQFPQSLQRISLR